MKKKIVMIIILAGLILIVALILGLNIYSDVDEIPTDYEAIKLKRTQCRGSCPVYSLVIYRNGTVVYIGESNVKIEGIQESQLDPKRVYLIFNETNYYSTNKPEIVIPEAYDVSLTLIYVQINGEFKELYYKKRTNKIIECFGEFIDIETNSSQWVIDSSSPSQRYFINPHLCSNK